MTRFRTGSASDVGQLRSNNQDSKLVADDLLVFAVADGMGGHQGGEVASAIAIDTLADVITSPTAASLVEAVKEANRRIFAQASETPEQRGMGTTLVAIALVDRGTDTEEMTWVNVGDSRVYVLRDGQLTQLSQDHSLVEDLRRGGQLSAEEAAVHPQRNILTRALGIDAEVEVDWRGVEPFLGDRYLLCSDGLFNEVDDDGIVEVLTTVEDPDEAAAELVRRANAGGGRDNITCVVVDVVDDDGRALRAAAAGSSDARPDLPATVEIPAAGAGVPSEDADPTPPAGTPAPPPPAPPDIVAGASAYPIDDLPPTADDDLPFGRATTGLYDDMEQVGGRHRLVTVLVAVVVLAAVIGAALFGIHHLDTDGYFIEETEGGRVVIYQGKPDGGILFDPTERDAAETPADELTAEDRAKLARTPTFPSLARARTELRTWEAQARKAEARRAEEEAKQDREDEEEKEGTTSTTSPPTTSAANSTDTTPGSTDG